MPLIDLEADNQETSLLLSSVRGLLGEKWSTKKLRRYAEGDKGVLDQISKDLIDMGVFQFASEAPPKDAAILNELLGSRLLPGITSSTLAAMRGVKHNNTGIRLESGGVSFSFSDIVPDPLYSEVVVTGNRLYQRDEVELVPQASFDSSMKLYKAIPKSVGRTVELNRSSALLPVIAQIVGSGEECVSIAVNYAKYRTAFGKPIGAFQAVKHKLVDDAMVVEFCRSLYLGAADDSSLIESAMKYVTKRIPKVITDAIQVHGGLGFTADADLHIHLKRVITLSKIFA